MKNLASHYKLLIALQLAVLAGTVLVACNQPDGTFFETVNKSKWNKTTIELHWTSRNSINDVCQRLGANDGPQTGGNYAACARSKPTDVTVCEIYAVEPENFDDANTLQTLGHETWHCLGAKHK